MQIWAFCLLILYVQSYARLNVAFLEDAAQNADLYIANQNVSMQI